MTRGAVDRLQELCGRKRFLHVRPFVTCPLRSGCEFTGIIPAHRDDAKLWLVVTQSRCELVAIGHARHHDISEQNRDLVFVFSPAAEGVATGNSFHHAETAPTEEVPHQTANRGFIFCDENHDILVGHGPRDIFKRVFSHDWGVGCRPQASRSGASAERIARSSGAHRRRGNQIKLVKVESRSLAKYPDGLLQHVSLLG